MSFSHKFVYRIAIAIALVLICLTTFVAYGRELVTITPSEPTRVSVDVAPAVTSYHLMLIGSGKSIRQLERDFPDLQHKLTIPTHYLWNTPQYHEEAKQSTVVVRGYVVKTSNNKQLLADLSIYIEKNRSDIQIEYNEKTMSSLVCSSSELIVIGSSDEVKRVTDSVNGNLLKARSIKTDHVKTRNRVSNNTIGLVHVDPSIKNAGEIISDYSDDEETNRSHTLVAPSCHAYSSGMRAFGISFAFVPSLGSRDMNSRDASPIASCEASSDVDVYVLDNVAELFAVPQSYKFDGTGYTFTVHPSLVTPDIEMPTSPIPNPDHGVAIARSIATQTKGANIHMIPVLNQNGDGMTYDILAGLAAVIEQIDASGRPGVINMSLSLGDMNLNDSTQLDQLVDQIVDNGSVIVAASGNDGLNTAAMPAAHPSVFAVGASNSANDPTCYSNQLTNSSGVGYGTYGWGGDDALFSQTCDEDAWLDHCQNNDESTCLAVWNPSDTTTSTNVGLGLGTSLVAPNLTAEAACMMAEANANNASLSTTDLMKKLGD